MPWIVVLLLLSVSSILAENLSLSWTNNMLRIGGASVPGGYVETWYLEAFCRSGSTHRDWNQTTIPHKTEMLEGGRNKLNLRTHVDSSVVVEHEIVAREDEVEFRLEARNDGKAFADVQWFQPCMRVDRFTGAAQSNYIGRSFIFTGDGLKRLSELARTEEAVYRGGQVYVPAGVPIEDVNPRPISKVVPANGLIGCFSKDGSKLLATAWESTQELFQGVIVCLHSDPRIGGLEPGQTKKLRGKIYILPNDPAQLIKRYQGDFGPAGAGKK